MKNNKFRNISLLSVAAVCALISCKTPTTISGEYAGYNFGVECVSVNSDGTQTLRSWGNGKDKSAAIEQAKRNAVETVMLKGITAGSGNCNKRPLVNEVNAREKYEDYFNAFFGDGGAYNKYVSLNEKRTSRIKSTNSTVEAWSVVVTVDRSALRKRLIDDNVISQ